jgi:hypothetical protein
MATMYENLCGNCVGGVELTFVWHFISVHLIFFSTDVQKVSVHCIIFSGKSAS